MADASHLFGPADLLLEAYRCLPELSDALPERSSVPESVLVDAVAYEMYAWVRDADEVDRDVVFRIFDLWEGVLERDVLDPEVRNVIVGSLGLIHVLDQPYGREAAERASARMRHLMEEAPRMISPLS